jgi:hypothetical protein
MLFDRKLKRQLEEKDREIARLRERVKRLRRQLPERTVAPENFVWIFGSPRSGSTWLAKMLSFPEGRDRWGEPFFGVVLALRTKIANQMYVERSKYVLGDEAKDVWLPSMRNLFLDGVAARFKDPLSALVVKEPNGSMSAPLIMEAFPESRMVLLVRDPRDVVASQLDASKEGSWYGQEEYEAGILDTGGGSLTERLARQYVLNVGAAAEAYERHEGPKSFVRYEDLRYDTRSELGRIDGELGLDCTTEELDRAVARYDWDAVPSNTKGTGRFRRKASPGSWRNDLTTDQAHTVEEITARLLRKFYAA